MHDCSGIVHCPYSPPREEGWLRRQENFGAAHLSAADGVVAHKSHSSVSADFFLMAAPYLEAALCRACAPRRACAGSPRRPLQQGGFAAYAPPKNLQEKTRSDTFVTQSHSSLFNELHFHFTPWRRNIRADQTLVTFGSNCGDAKNVIIDDDIRQHKLRHVADGLLVLPVVCPRIAPVNAISNGTWRSVPTEICIVAGRLSADHHLVSLVHDFGRRRCKRQRSGTGRIHPSILRQILDIDTVQGVIRAMLFCKIFIRFSKHDGRITGLVERRVVAAPAEPILSCHQPNLM